MIVQEVIALEDRPHVGTARRCAAQMAEALRFDATAAGRVALCVTELATNIVKHAGSGKIVLRPLVRGTSAAIELLALDRGPGMSDIKASLRDGHSTAGGMGMGLGALSRASASFDVYSLPGRGTAVRLELWAGKPVPAELVEYGVVSLPLAGESVCGDQWYLQELGERRTVLVVDGIGHGLLAAEAARTAVAILQDNPSATPGALLERCHAALARSRGAAAAAASIVPAEARGTFAGIGNISCRLHSEQSHQQLVSHGGTLGHAVRRTQEFAFDFPAGSLLILYSDGLASRWTLADYPALAQRHPGLIAGVLYRDHDRGRDDVTVVVLKNTVH